MTRVLHLRRAALAMIGVFALVAPVAQAATYTAVASYADPLGGRTSLLGINNAGWLTGSVNYLGDGTGQGLVRDAAGTYSVFSLGAFTQGRAISEANQVSGYANAIPGDFITSTEFTRTAGGAVTILQNPDTGLNLRGIAQGMTSTGVVVGDYFTGVGTQRRGYILDGATFTELTLAGSPTTSVRARALNEAGDLAGWTIDTGGTPQAFIRSGGIYAFFNAPGAVNGTFFEDLNNNGVAVGSFIDAVGNSHAFTYDSNTSLFTNLDIAGATNIQAFGINDLGQVILTTDHVNGPNNFIYDPNGVPEPATWAMMLLGFGAAGAALRRRRREFARLVRFARLT